MAQIKLEAVMSRIDSEMKSALRIALNQQFPDKDVDVNSIYRTFKRKVASKCSSWVTIPDDYVMKE